jgi:hypothetical protein
MDNAALSCYQFRLTELPPMNRRTVIAHWLARIEQQLPHVDCDEIEIRLRYYVDEASFLGIKNLDAHLRRRASHLLTDLRFQPKPPQEPA